MARCPTDRSSPPGEGPLAPHHRPTGAGEVAPGMAPPDATTGPDVVALHDRRATDARLSGSKAAASATAAGRGLPVLPGFVLTTAATAAGQAVALGPEVQAAWRELSGDGRRSLVVRSSSTVEDLAGSSMAGRYESVIGVEGWDAFVAAVHAVVASREKAAEGSAALTGEEPLDVLVQPLLDSTVGGVLFGVDPVSGRSDHLVVVASTEGPDAVVSGRVGGSRYVVDRHGRVVRADHGPGGARLGRRQLSALVNLAATAAELFGGHQDVEWAFDRPGALVLLQSRPVTTDVVGAPMAPSSGPVRSRRPSPSRLPHWSRACGSNPCGRRSARHRLTRSTHTGGCSDSPSVSRDAA